MKKNWKKKYEAQNRQITALQGQLKRQRPNSSTSVRSRPVYGSKANPSTDPRYIQPPDFTPQGRQKLATTKCPDLPNCRYGENCVFVH